MLAPAFKLISVDLEIAVVGNADAKWVKRNEFEGRVHSIVEMLTTVSDLKFQPLPPSPIIKKRHIEIEPNKFVNPPKQHLKYLANILNLLYLFIIY